MADDQQNPGVMGFFNSMPGWARSVVFVLTVVPISVAISGMLLNVNVGSYLDSYMEIQLERQRQATEAAADRIISAFDERLIAIEASLEEAAKRDTELADHVEEVDKRVSALEGHMRRLDSWACGGVLEDGLVENDPEWCE